MKVDKKSEKEQEKDGGGVEHGEKMYEGNRAEKVRKGGKMDG